MPVPFMYGHAALRFGRRNALDSRYPVLSHSRGCLTNGVAATEEDLRSDLALCYRCCEYFRFHEGVCNHLSVALSGNDRFLLIPYGCHWSQVTASKLLTLDYQGKVLRGSGRPEITAFISHRAIHSKLLDEAAVILHTHMPFATTLTLLRANCGGCVLPVHQNAARFHNRVAYDSKYAGLFVDDDESERVADVAAKFANESGNAPRAMFCASHGVFVFARTIQEAWSDLYYLERLCEVQVRALSCVGGDVSKLRLIDSEVLCAAQRQYENERLIEASAQWQAMKSVLGSLEEADDRYGN